MSTFVLIVFLHSASAVLLLGTTVLGEPIVRALARRASTTRELLAYLQVSRPMAMVSPIAALVLFASGVYLTNISHYWSEGWLQVAVALWVVNGTLAVLFVQPAVRRVAAAVGNGGDVVVGDELDASRWSWSWSWGGDAMATNDAAVLLLMIWQPTLLTSLIVVGAANTVAVVVRLLVGLRPAAPVTARSPVS